MVAVMVKDGEERLDLQGILHRPESAGERQQHKDGD